MTQGPSLPFHLLTIYTALTINNFYNHDDRDFAHPRTNHSFNIRALTPSVLSFHYIFHLPPSCKSAEMLDYAQYKWETNNCISWVINTANTLGSTIRPIDGPGQRPPGAGRLKGKARAEVRRAQATTPSLTTATQPPRYVVSTWEILAQAQYIANSGVTVTMPRTVWRSFSLAIHARQQHAKRYTEEERSTTTGNSGHAYFIQVLQQTVNMLSSCVQARPTLRGNDDSNSKSYLKLHNLFDVLAMDEPETIEFLPQDSNDPDETDSDYDEVPTKELPKSYEPEIDSQEEMQFEWFLYFGLVTSLRDHTLGKWNVEEDGAHDVVGAMLVTEAAVTLVQDKFTSITRIAQRLGVDSLIYMPESDDPLNDTMESLVDIKMQRQQSDGFLLPVPHLKLRKSASEEVTDQWVQEDTFLVQYLMDLGLECVCHIHYFHLYITD